MLVYVAIHIVKIHSAANKHADLRCLGFFCRQYLFATDELLFFHTEYVICYSQHNSNADKTFHLASCNIN